MKPLKALGFLLASFISVPLYAQSPEAAAARAALIARAADPSFASAASAEAAKMASLDDTIWLISSLAAEAAIPDQRKAMLAEAASLLELVGRYEAAADSWEAAAATVAGVADARMLVSAAACRLVAGDAAGAAALAAAVAFLSPDAVSASRASIVSGWAALARDDRAVALAAGKAAIDDPDASIAVSGLLLARAACPDGSAERAEYDAILVKRFPGRPESSAQAPLPEFLLAASAKAGTVIVPAASAPPAPAASAPKPAAPTAVGSTSAASSGTASASAGTASDKAGTETAAARSPIRFYQVGAFKAGANATALAGKLEKLGLKVYSKKKGGTDLYIVYVAAGADPGATVLTLKDAGYEAWPIDQEP
jgi:hypothetical protein